MNNIFLIEDHDEALKVWRQNRLKGLDLVHLDAHIDFASPSSKPAEKVIKQARSLKELKNGLEHSIAFMQYEKDFDKQTNTGNYIYPAIQEGIIKNFYWVIPGGQKEFKKSYKNIKDIVGNITRNTSLNSELVKINPKNLKKEIIPIKFLDGNLIICNLKSLPVLRHNVLLDIDTDFLVIDSLLSSNNTAKIGKRMPWILPKELVGLLKNKIKKPEVITIAYSVNGGYTPIKFKYLADEIAYNFAPSKFKKRLQNNLKAAKNFNLFISTGKKDYYQKSVKLNPTYRAADNNYGPLYFSELKFSLAQKEFSKILEADPKNIGCLFGLGNIALEKRNLKQAKRYFSSILNSKGNKLFSKVKNQSLLGLAKAEFNMENFSKAKKLLCRYRSLDPLNPETYYFLGRIYEKERDFEHSVTLYKDALTLGFNDNLEVIYRLLRISKQLKEKDALIKYIAVKYSDFKKAFKKSSKKEKNIRGLAGIKRKISRVEKILRENHVKN